MSRVDWTPDEETSLRLLYPDTPTDDLVVIFGRSSHSIKVKAHRLELSKTVECLAKIRSHLDPESPTRTAFLKKITPLLCRVNGVSTSEAASVGGLELTHAKTVLRRLKRHGLVHLYGLSYQARYFLTAEGAEAGAKIIREERVRHQREVLEAKYARNRAKRAAEIALRPPKSPRETKATKVRITKPKQPKEAKPLKLAKSKPRKDDPVASFKNQQASNPRNVVPTVLPGFTGNRWGVSERVVGGFATMKLGSYPLPASSWVQA